MNQREMDRNLPDDKWRNSRMDWISADIVERGIEMYVDKGYEQAANYLKDHHIDSRVIERVLTNRLDRRAQISGAL